MTVPLWLSTVKLVGYHQRIINLTKVSHGKWLASSLTENWLSDLLTDQLLVISDHYTVSISIKVRRKTTELIITEFGGY